MIGRSVGSKFLYDVGRTTAYSEIKAKRLQVVKVGKRTLVPADSAEILAEKSSDRTSSIMSAVDAARALDEAVRTAVAGGVGAMTPNISSVCVKRVLIPELG